MSDVAEAIEAARFRWAGLYCAENRAWPAIEAAYAGAGRHYHDLRHVVACLDEAMTVYDKLDDYRAVDTAIFFHDAVYDPTRGDNEERSAELAERQLRQMGRPDGFVAKVRELILDTRHRERPATSDGRYLVDIDLAILGKPAEVFDAYDRAIRLEYAHVPEEAYRAGRAKVLRGFWGRPAIYYTEHFRKRYEAAARGNLARAIAACEGAGRLA